MTFFRRKWEPNYANGLNPKNADGAVAISRCLRDVSPAHFTFKVESFSILLKTSIEKLESDIFEAGGYKWRLSLYPKGNTKGNGNQHISLYLVIADTNDFPLGWEVFVSFKLFVFDHINNKYLTIQDADEELRRFSNIKNEWGFDQLLPLSAFNDASNHYLNVDCCIFGAEVFVHKFTGRAECVSRVEPKGETYTWVVDKFSTLLDKEYKCSDVFTIGGHKWMLVLYPKGNKQKEKFLSLYLQRTDWPSESPGQGSYAEYKLRIRDQTTNAHAEMEYQFWFYPSRRIDGGSEFLSVSSLNDPHKGYKLKDIVIVEVELKTPDKDNKIVETMKSSRRAVPTTKDTKRTNDVAISRSLRDDLPAHFTFKVESFSLWSKTGLEKLESDIFEAGGYKWRLALYPEGNTRRNGNDHISLYLVIAGIEDVPCGCDIYVSFKFFVFDHINDKFLTIQDGKLRRFSNIKTEWGFDQLLPLSSFNDVSNGYIDLDSCIFGAEVFVHKYTGRADCISMVEPKNNTYTWTIENFSTLLDEKYYSDEFTVGGCKWKLLLYPRGFMQKEFLSLYLEMVDWKFETPAQRLYVEFKLRIMNQYNNGHYEFNDPRWFSALSENWGCAKFLLLSRLNDQANGFKLKDTVIVQAEIKVMAFSKKWC